MFGTKVALVTTDKESMVRAVLDLGDCMGWTGTYSNDVVSFAELKATIEIHDKGDDYRGNWGILVLHE